MSRVEVPDLDMYIYFFAWYLSKQCSSRFEASLKPVGYCVLITSPIGYFIATQCKGGWNIGTTISMGGSPC